MKVINLFGAPGAGKSTTAAGLFSLMKVRGHNCELVTEYAKELTWEERKAALGCQAHVLGEQLMRFHRLKGKVDFVITDSPILLSSVYAPKELPKAFHDYVLWEHRQQDSVNFLIRRTKPFNPSGRNQTEEESDALYLRIFRTLKGAEVRFYSLPGDGCAPEVIYYTLRDIGVVR